MTKELQKLQPVVKEINSLKKLFVKISNHIESAKSTIQRTVDSEMVKTYWLIGQDILKEEQRGKKRADYGSYLLKELSKRLTQTYGKGFGLSTLKDIRLFYMTYEDRKISHARGQSKKIFSQNLGWTHYRNLMRVDRPEARRFYEIEAEKNHWSSRELESPVYSKKSILELKRQDIEEYLQFCLRPPRLWIGLKRVPRFVTRNGECVPHKEWRPFVATVSKTEHQKGISPDKLNYHLS